MRTTPKFRALVSKSVTRSWHKKALEDNMLCPRCKAEGMAKIYEVEGLILWRCKCCGFTKELVEQDKTTNNSHT